MFRRLSPLVLVVALIVATFGPAFGVLAAQSSPTPTPSPSASAESSRNPSFNAHAVLTRESSEPSASPRSTASSRASASPRATSSPRASSSPRTTASPRASASPRGSDPYGCKDLNSYQLELGIAVLGTMDPKFIDDPDFTTMTQREINLFVSQLGEFIEAMEDITPPVAAKDYHDAMIDTFVLLERMLRDYATTGSIFALLPYTDLMDSVDWAVYEAELAGHDMCGSAWVDVFGYPEMPDS